MNKESNYTWKLGMFVIIGLVFFVITIYFIGKQKNLFGTTFRLKSQFKNVSGLKIGNNVRFSGINVGTVDAIELITETSVMVDLLIKEEVRQFIKSDATASIGSDGLMGDKVLTISPGTSTKLLVKDNDIIASKSAVEIEDVMKGMKTTVDNAAIITNELAQFSRAMNNGDGAISKLMTDKTFANSLKGTLVNLETSTNEFAKFTTKMNSGKGALSKMMNDEKFGKTLDSTMANLQAGTKGLSENMEAAKHNFLLKGYFTKKEKAEAKKRAELKLKEEMKKKNGALSPKDSTKKEN